MSLDCKFQSNAESTNMTAKLNQPNFIQHFAGTNRALVPRHSHAFNWHCPRWKNCACNMSPLRQCSLYMSPSTFRTLSSVEDFERDIADKYYWFASIDASLLHQSGWRQKKNNNNNKNVTSLIHKPAKRTFQNTRHVMSFVFFRNARALQDRIGIWKCRFLRKGKNRRARRKKIFSEQSREPKTNSTHI